MFLTASNTPSLREKKIWQNAQTLWPHIYTINVEIRRLWHDIPRFFVHFLEKQIFLLKRRKCKVCLPFQLLEIETGRQSNCFSYSTSGWASDRLVGVIISTRLVGLQFTVPFRIIRIIQYNVKMEISAKLKARHVQIHIFHTKQNGIPWCFEYWKWSSQIQSDRLLSAGCAK